MTRHSPLTGVVKTYLIEAAGVVITVVDPDLAAINASIASDCEVVWHEGLSIWLERDVALEEGALGLARVGLLGLSHHD